MSDTLRTSTPPLMDFACQTLAWLQRVLTPVTLSVDNIWYFLLKSSASIHHGRIAHQLRGLVSPLRFMTRLRAIPQTYFFRQTGHHKSRAVSAHTTITHVFDGLATAASSVYFRFGISMISSRPLFALIALCGACLLGRRPMRRRVNNRNFLQFHGWRHLSVAPHSSDCTPPVCGVMILRLAVRPHTDAPSRKCASFAAVQACLRP